MILAWAIFSGITFTAIQYDLSIKGDILKLPKQDNVDSGWVD